MMRDLLTSGQFLAPAAVLAHDEVCEALRATGEVYLHARMEA